ncbi:MAG TPA: hypothetical protein VF584_15665 [Longimicrobium sp.]|jgi:hypothetical protein
MARKAYGEKALDPGEGKGAAAEPVTGPRGKAAYTYGIPRGTKRVAVREKQTDAFKMFQGQQGTQVFYQDAGVGSARAKKKRVSAKSFREGIEQSLQSRALEVFRAALKRMTPEQLQHAVGASTAAGTIVEVLNASPDVGLRKETAMTRALARGAVAKQEMIQESGGCFSSGQVAKLLGITQSGVNLRRSRSGILAVPLSGGEWGFPARQFQDGELRPGLAEVLRAGSAMSPWVLLSILLDPVPGSKDTVILDALDRPEVREDMLNRIATYGHHVAS